MSDFPFRVPDTLTAGGEDAFTIGLPALPPVGWPAPAYRGEAQPRRAGAFIGREQPNMTPNRGNGVIGKCGSTQP
ncbi:hypothetical protein [Stenotrophomonas sp. SY1]|uniref:hypothetical protein n=1 Tax=Stenotrophomonas sp. SY1 TaxID=477235 RepID=UPI001E3FB859|nr:hypothetical protein [Stenotrophomonas sp. SY1]MCD9085871.1 hypothetical protein [Stenotrophomonas sp. SY1]